MAKIVRNLSVEELGDFLREQWEKGNISEEDAALIHSGRVPRRLDYNELSCTIERMRQGIRLTISDDGLDEILNLQQAA